MFKSIVGVCLLASTASAMAMAMPKCVNITVPVDISARNGVFDVEIPKTNIDATAFALAATRRFPNNATAAVTKGYRTVSGKYNISAQYCEPTGEKTPTHLQILTHGIGFDKTYWNLAYNGFSNSYTNVANGAGYATLAYDRLGIGKSSHGNPRDEIQSFLEIAALAEITKMLRKGTFPMVSTMFKKIIHVGHSFGSAQTYAMTAMYPDISDGIVLTGFSTSTDYVSLFNAGNDYVQAYLNQPLRLGSQKAADTLELLTSSYGLTDLMTPFDISSLPMPLNYPPGYLINSNVGALVYLFLYPGNFDTGIAYYGEMGKQPVTIGELLTLGSVPSSSMFPGPVLIVTGEHDVPFCGGQCLHTGNKYASIPAEAKVAFPKTSNFEAYIQPRTGHGINFHHNATAAYNVIQHYLEKNGLTAM